MKSFSWSIIFVLIFLAGCSDESTSSTGSGRADSSTSSMQDSTGQGTAQASNPSDGLMASMNSMMGDMKAMQMTGDPDHDFASMMVKHHNGAIEMSAVETSTGTDSTLKRLAVKITEDSRKDNLEFESFLKEHKPATRSDFSEKAMAMLNNSAGMHSMSGKIDTDYGMMMVQHHKDGISMAKEYLKTGKAAEPIKLAKNIIKMQEKDIQELENAISASKK